MSAVSLLKSSFKRLTRVRDAEQDVQADRLRLQSLARAIADVTDGIEDERRQLTRRLSNLQAWVGGLLGSGTDEGFDRPQENERDLREAEGRMRVALRRLARLDELDNLCTALQILLDQSCAPFRVAESAPKALVETEVGRLDT